MFRLWGKIWKDNRMIRDAVFCDDRQETRTHKVFHCLEQLCSAFDLENPIWLDSNIRQFQSHGRTRFGAGSFIEEIDFDHLEIQVIEEDP
ncbi:MAG: hypothetical protein Q4D55_02825 [Eubacteriales bacterium]|nr:hypothetical protein [Eubacteriales bacterium]